LRCLHTSRSFYAGADCFRDCPAACSILSCIVFSLSTVFYVLYFLTFSRRRWRGVHQV